MEPEKPSAEQNVRAALSALTDGRADAALTTQALRAFAEDPQARARWHAYQLVGDVMRSEDLAGAPGHDEHFLQALRGRLAAEPPPAALPSAQAAAAQGVRPALTVVPEAVPVALRTPRWMWPTALAASVGGVAAVMLVWRLVATPAAEMGTLALAPAASAAGPVAAAVDPQAEPVLQRVAGGALLRDARIDRYLRAHRELQAGMALTPPVGAMRNLETVAYER